jgi:hypothetical protein
MAAATPPELLSIPEQQLNSQCANLARPWTDERSRNYQS